MSESIRLQELSAATGVQEVDESRWQAWKVRHTIRDRENAASRLAAVKYGSLAVLLATTILGAQAAPYHVVIRFAVSAGALVVAAQAFRLRRYGFAAAFVAMILIYNPVFAAFPMTEGLPFPLAVVTVLAFFSSLVRLRNAPAGDARGSVAHWKRSPLTVERPPLKAGLSAWENEGGAPLPPALEVAGLKQNGASK